MGRTVMLAGTVAVAVAAVIVGCTDPGQFVNTDPLTRCSVLDEIKCEGNVAKRCVDGVLVDEDCGEKTCVVGKGCRNCAPNSKYCRDQDVFACDAEGEVETLVETCPADQTCAMGECYAACKLPRDAQSNVGCEFWAVDLPNEYFCQSIDGGETCLMWGCAACQQFAVALANTSGLEVQVTVERNDAPVGQPAQLAVVDQRRLGPETLDILFLPMREVDCTEWRTDSTGKMRRTNDSQTCVTSNAYRITTSYPVVAYQFNPILNDFSNGASLMLPTTGLDNEYLVMGWYTANPIDIPMPGVDIEGTPDYMNLTIAGVKPNTQVEVTLAHQIQGSADGKIPAAKAGETIRFEVGPFDVVNLNTLQDLDNPSGDLTGTRVKADQPIVVFSGGQRTLVPGNLDKYPVRPPEPDGEYDVCCTEHFEQQMFPISSLGTTFAVTRTPVRSDTEIIEPDFYRILASEDGTRINTSLTEFPDFTLDAGKYVEFWSTRDFVVNADKPIMLAQYAVCQGFLDGWEGAAGGDPEFVIFPPVEQFRKEYLFICPPTFDKDYVIISAPDDAIVHLDHQQVTGEFKTICERHEAGTIGGQLYVALRCPVADGLHIVEADKPVGITVYGYYSVGSYGYPGGADVRRINVD